MSSLAGDDNQYIDGLRCSVPLPVVDTSTAIQDIGPGAGPDGDNLMFE